MGFNIEIIKGVMSEKWLRLEVEWNSLADRFTYPLVRFEWFHAAARFLCNGEDVRLIAVRRGGKLAGVLPLCQSRVSNGCGLEMTLMGAQELGEPAKLLCDGLDAFERLIGAAASFRLPLRLARFREEDVPFDLFKQWTKRRLTLVVRRTAESSPYLSIAGTWDDYENRLSGRRRYDLRRARRRAEEIGQVELEVTQPELGGLEKVLDLFFEVEAHSWKGRSGSALKHHHRLGAFFRDYSQAVCAQGLLRVGIMRIDSQPAALLLGVEVYNRFWVLKIGYDEKFGACSPGILLMHHVLKNAFETGLSGFEFLGSDENWLRMWPGRKLHANVSYGIFPAGWHGWSALVREAAGRGLKMWRARRVG